MLRPLEERIQRVLAHEGLMASRWSNGPGAVYPVHDHSYGKVLYCLEGSIQFRMEATGHEVLLEPGDRLNIPAGAAHGAVVGSQGVVCLEAHQEAVPAATR